MQIAPALRSSTRHRSAIWGAVAMTAVVLAACGSATPLATRQAQAYAESANLKPTDLPTSWSTKGSSNSMSVTAVTMNSSEANVVNPLLAGLPASCHPLDPTFIGSLLSSPPIGSLVQNQIQFTSATDSNSVLTSVLAVFGTLSRAQARYALYAAPTFASCLELFLHATLVKIFSYTEATVSVTTQPTPPPPAGVEATAFSVAQSASKPGSKTQVSIADEVVIQAGRAVAFVEMQNASTSLPPDAVTALGQSVSLVEHRMVPPPS